MAIENAVAASIPDYDTQKNFDRISLYFGIGCFLVIHIVAVAFVITKVRSLSSAWLLIFLDVCRIYKCNRKDWWTAQLPNLVPKPG